MKPYIACRVTEIANYVLETGATVRQAGKHFAVSKSTVHKDLQERLRMIDLTKWHKVMAILDVNMAERHIRGGNATKQKYILCRQNQSK